MAKKIAGEEMKQVVEEVQKEEGVEEIAIIISDTALGLFSKRFEGSQVHLGLGLSLMEKKNLFYT